MEKAAIDRLFKEAGLPEITSIKILSSTFSNDVQVINGKFILKSWNPDNIKWFDKELFCLTQLQGVIPVIPRIINSYRQSKIPGKSFLIMEKLPGKTLTGVWRKLTGKQQEQLISRICAYLKIVSRMDITAVPELFPRINNWQEWLKQEFGNNLQLCTKEGLLLETEAAALKEKFQSYYPFLKEQQMRVMYYDIHFENFLVEDGILTGIVDFERTDWVSVDYVLNWVRRMALFPGEYLKDKDPEQFANIMPLFRKFYPELFAFTHLEARLKSYALLSDLRINIRKGSLPAG